MKNFIFIAFVLGGFNSLASTLNLDNVSASDLIMIFKEFSALTDHSSVSPASSLESWGFEIGILAGATKTPNVQSLVTRTGASDDVSELPRAELLGRLTFPHSITAEIAGLPQVNISGISIAQWGAAVQWTFTDELWLESPVDLALKAKYARTKISTTQVIQNSSTLGVPVTADVHFADSVYGLNLLVSHSFEVIEPYASFGYVMASGDLVINGTSGATIFAPSYTDAQAVHSQLSSWEGMLGFNVYPVPFLAFGLEYSRAFDASTYTAKLSVQFD